MLAKGGNQSQGLHYQTSGTTTAAAQNDVNIPISVTGNRGYKLFALKCHDAGGWHSCIYQFCSMGTGSSPTKTDIMTPLLPTPTTGSISGDMTTTSNLRVRFSPGTGGNYDSTYLVMAWLC
jgi:hypothetical protein